MKITKNSKITDTTCTDASHSAFEVELPYFNFKGDWSFAKEASANIGDVFNKDGKVLVVSEIKNGNPVLVELSDIMSDNTTKVAVSHDAVSHPWDPSIDVVAGKVTASSQLGTYEKDWGLADACAPRRH